MALELDRPGGQLSIRLLSPEVADAIAAGEVIERPAAAVKELIENSLDAGASRVSILVQGAGQGLIQVSDDGTGIDSRDLELAFARHATSKVNLIDDLARIASLGFRGEALASISAVSKVQCRSKQADAIAHELIVEAGRIVSMHPSSGARGTTITVSDLFFNTPARRKFLKSDAREGSAIVRTCQTYALSHPQVAFELTMERRRVLRTSGSGDLQVAVGQVYGSVQASMTAVSMAIAPYRVSGLCSLPSVSRANRDQVLVCVNSRPVFNRTLTFAVEDAYRGLLESGRHPIAVLHLELPIDMVDVNVHPSKREVRLTQESNLFGLIQRSIREAVAGSTPTFSLSAAPAPAPAGAVFQPELGPALDVGFRAGQQRSQVTQAPSPKRHADGILRALGQAGPGYLVAEAQDGLLLVDQHAAHERVLYNRILASLNEGVLASQELLVPIIVDLTSDLMLQLPQAKGLLGRLGMVIEVFGERSVRITSVPPDLSASSVAAAFTDIMAGLGAGNGAVEQLRQQTVAASLACHSAIRFGDSIALEEQRTLLADLQAARDNSTCPHGRPTRLAIGWTELRRQFRRNY